MGDKTLVASARTRRLARFVDQLGLYLSARCVENQLPTAMIDSYTSDIFSKMMRSRDEYGVIELLQLLANDEMLADIFNGYKARLIKLY